MIKHASHDRCRSPVLGTADWERLAPAEGCWCFPEGPVHFLKGPGPVTRPAAPALYSSELRTQHKLVKLTGRCFVFSSSGWISALEHHDQWECDVKGVYVTSRTCSVLQLCDLLLQLLNMSGSAVTLLWHQTHLHTHTHAHTRTHRHTHMHTHTHTHTHALSINTLHTRMVK